MSGALQGITVVGGIVPPVLLARIQSGEVRDASSLASSSYHLPGTETTRDAASRAWGYLRGVWEAWRAADADRRPDAPGTGLARERWLLVLLRELGYGQVPATSGAIAIGDDEYPISHRWNHIVMHLLGPGVNLDRRNAGVAGAARAPQAMLQEYLNREPQHLWAILSNGRQLRLLRDSTSLAGSAYLEFDLETIFDGELYPEFLLFWQLTQFSRLEKRGGPDAPPSDCWLESWRGEAVDAGTRALDKLRDGVEEAIARLGTGLLKHPHNRWLTQALYNGDLSDRDFHKALLRTVYRLLFCFVAEDRDAALLDPSAPAEARDRYQRYFSTARLRRLSRRRAGGPHPDLWRAQRLVLQALGGHGLPEIAVPALGGLFDPDSREPTVPDQPTPDLILGADIANADLLPAIRALAWVGGHGTRVQPVDYRHLGAEELGSVYESLLELIPRVDLAQRSFTLERLSGNERKTTGSYYTPPALVSALLDSALDPVLDDAVKNADSPQHAEQRLLALTICDPACGSGGFLVAAARRIARRLAAVRSGEDEPTPKDVQHALHNVVGRCIYGVDLNDLAAELAKVSLWLEALEPGRPLGFLDARIRVGNSLLGTTPGLLAEGVPDIAFKELEGDDKKYAAAVRKRNKAEAGQHVMSFESADADPAALRKARSALLAASGGDVDQVRAQAQDWEEYERSEELRRRRLHADAWCAAFVWPLHAGAAQPPTDAILRRIADEPDALDLGSTVREVGRLDDEYRFFHWHLEFPEIFGDLNAADTGPEGWPGGFSCLLGNPPWERVKLQEQEFFAARDPEIAKAPNAAARRKLIAQLEDSDPALFAAFRAARRRAEGESAVLRTSARYPLNGRGDVNTYAVFAELFRSLTAPHGRSGVIVPTGIATDATTQYFFKDLVTTNSLAALYDFENRAPIFESVDSRFKFCLLTTTGREEHETAASFAFFLHDPLAISAAEFALTPDEITLLNPNTGTVPIFRTRRDAEITVGIYRRVPVLVNENDPVNGNPWGVSFMRMFDMTNDSHLFHTREELETDGWALNGNRFTLGQRRMLPLYQGMMATFYNHRAADVLRSATAVKRQNQPSYLTRDDLADPTRVVLPMYWVDAKEMPSNLPPWLLAFSNVSSPTNERSMVPYPLPLAAVGHSTPIIFCDHPVELLAILSSLVLDYALRQKLGGVNLTYNYVQQLPIPAPDALFAYTSWLGGSFSEWLRPRILELVYTAVDMAPFARGLGDESGPYIWDEGRRIRIRAEIDGAVLQLYGVGRKEAEQLLESFPIVRRKDIARFDEFLTKRLVLESFDAMQSAIRVSRPFQTLIDPAPGEGARREWVAEPE